MAKKIDYQKLEKKLVSQKKSCWETWSESISRKANGFSEDYKIFLSASKTERESVAFGIKLAKQKGYKEISQFKELKAGDKVFAINRDKNLVLIKIGKKMFDKGARILMSHIDSPRIDLKISPLYEEEGLGFFKTQYYGGIKKHQWPTIALALHGVIFKKDGTKVEITIGENDNEPIFMITDLLPHLDRVGGPGTKTGGRKVEGEHLNLLVGSRPIKNDKVKEKVKLAILDFLNKKYGIVEEDFASAEISAVPSEKARDLGFDKSMISAYGHDDKICSYASIMAILDSKIKEETQICYWVDKEEIGSEGNTGAKSIFLEMLISDLLKLSKKKYGLNEVYKIFSKTKVFSTDVTAAVDPDYKDVHDLRNAPRMGFGVAVEKYVGSGGKYSTSDASAEFLSELRQLFNENKNIIYQVGGGLGKVDIGGGGTIAAYLASRNMEIIDIGIPLFNMHAPLEIASKADLYSAYLAYKAFVEK